MGTVRPILSLERSPRAGGSESYGLTPRRKRQTRSSMAMVAPMLTTGLLTSLEVEHHFHMQIQARLSLLALFHRVTSFDCASYARTVSRGESDRICSFFEASSLGRPRPPNSSTIALQSHSCLVTLPQSSFR